MTKQILIACAFSLFVSPCVWAQERISSQFTTLNSQAQKSLEPIKGLYQQISDQWLILRLDPNVSEKAVRQLLDQVAEELSHLTKKTDLPEPEKQKLLQQQYDKLLQAQIKMLPARSVELRGALLDAGMLPTQAGAMRDLLKRLKKAGFNAVFPEVFRRGNAMFINPIIELDPSLQSQKIDVLKLLTDAARAEQMEVYPWFWMFRVLSPTVAKQNQLTKRLPALMARPLDGQVYQSNGEVEDESKSFMSPASQDWRQLLATLMMDTAQRYPVQGFLMDYIRYGNNQTEDELSLTRFQLDYYRKVGSFPPPRILPTSDLQAEWHLWREEQVHSMVRELKLQIADKKKPLSLGAAVFRNEIQARNTKMQHWRHWSNNGWLDFASPMMYTDEFRELDLWMEWETNKYQRHDLLYPIIGAHKIKGNRLEFLDQISLLQQRKANGVSVFSMRNVNENMLRDLAEGPFRLPARIPHHNVLESLAVQLKDFSGWLRGVEQRGAETQSLSSSSRAPLATLAQKYEQLSQTVRSGGPRLDAVALVSTLETELLNSTRAFPEPLRARMLIYLNDSRELAEIFQQHQRLKNQGYVPPSRPPSEVLKEARAIPELRIPEVEQAPNIDSRLDDPAWKEAAVLPPLYWSAGSGRADTPTEIRVMYDKNALYLAYVNDEPRTDRMHISARPSEDFLQRDDTIHLFINPVQAAQNYYYFVVNPDNVRLQRASFDRSWSRPWQSATRAFPHGWIAEVAIPFQSLGVKTPEQNTTWRANFCRRRPQETADFHCWSITFGGVHRIDRFGTLRFKPLPKKPESANGAAGK